MSDDDDNFMTSGSSASNPSWQLRENLKRQKELLARIRKKEREESKFLASLRTSSSSHSNQRGHRNQPNESSVSSGDHDSQFPLSHSPLVSMHSQPSGSPPPHHGQLAVEMIRQENERLCAESVRHEETIQDLRDEVAALLQHKDDSMRLKAQAVLQAEEAKIRNDECRAKIGELSDRLQSVLSTESNLRQQIIEADKQKLAAARSVNVKMSNLEAEVAQLRAEHDHHALSETKLKDRLRRLEDDLTQANNKVRAGEARLTSDRAKYQEHTQLASDQLRRLESENGGLRSLVDDSDTSIAELKSDLGVKQLEIDLLLQSKTEVQSKARALREELAQETRLNHAMRAESDSQRDDIDALSERAKELDTVREHNARLKDECEQLAQECERLAETEKELGQAVATLTEAKREIQSRLETGEAQNARLIRQNTDFVERLKQIPALNQQLDQALEVNASLRRTIDEEQNEKRELASQFDALRDKTASQLQQLQQALSILAVSPAAELNQANFLQLGGDSDDPDGLCQLGFGAVHTLLDSMRQSVITVSEKLLAMHRLSRDSHTAERSARAVAEKMSADLDVATALADQANAGHKTMEQDLQRATDKCRQLEDLSARLERACH